MTIIWERIWRLANRAGILILLFGDHHALAQYSLDKLIPSGLRQPTRAVLGVGADPNYYLLERAGRVLKFNESTSKLTPFLDISSQVRTDAEELGLFGFAFHPRYAINGRYFVAFTPKGKPLRWVLRAYDKGGSRDLIVLNQSFPNGQGGDLIFDRDGKLLVALGDGGGTGDPDRVSESADHLMGKILRIDVDQMWTSAGKPVGSKFSNHPWIKMFAKGFQNPSHLSWDPVKGSLFVTDRGQWKWQEINVVESGGHYGWSTLEGLKCYRPRKNCEQQNKIAPIYAYGSKIGLRISGGFVYRGMALKKLTGSYLFADFASEFLMRLQPLEEKADYRWELLMRRVGAVSSIIADHQGEPLILNYRGSLSRLVSLPKKASLP